MEQKTLPSIGVVDGDWYLNTFTYGRWMAGAIASPTKAFQAALAIVHEAQLRGHWSGGSNPTRDIVIRKVTKEKFGLSRHTFRTSLQALEELGLVDVLRSDTRSPRISLRGPHKFLIGGIPQYYLDGELIDFAVEKDMFFWQIWVPTITTEVDCD